MLTFHGAVVATLVVVAVVFGTVVAVPSLDGIDVIDDVNELIPDVLYVLTDTTYCNVLYADVAAYITVVAVVDGADSIICECIVLMLLHIVAAHCCCLLFLVLLLMLLHAVVEQCCCILLLVLLLLLMSLYTVVDVVSYCG